jgi:hypothetical protein
MTRDLKQSISPNWNIGGKIPREIQFHIAKKRYGHPAAGCAEQHNEASITGRCYS